jgi:hypothetical protein
MAGDNTLAGAALAIALVALLTTVGQLLQQYFGTADGFRRCQNSVVGPWAKRTRLKFRWSEFRFETLFTVPHITLQRTVWASSEMPECPYPEGGWILGRPETQKGADEVNLLISGRAADTPESVTWLRFLRSIQWTHKRMMFKLSRVTQADSEKNDLSLRRHENRNLTIPLVKFEERSWDFMPPDIVKPYARINIGDLGVLARRLGMEWDRFEPSDGVFRAQGNGYNLTSVLVRSVGTMVEINEVLGSGTQNSPLPSLTPVIPEHVERKMLLIPCAAADKMAFGILPGVGSDFMRRDFDVSSPESTRGLLGFFTKNEALVAAFASGQWQQSGWCPGVADLLSIIAPMMYRPVVGLLGIPAPDNGILFHGVTAAGAGESMLHMFLDAAVLLTGTAFVEFKNCLHDLIRRTDAASMPSVVWLYEKISSLSAASDEWTNEVDLLARYWNDKGSQTLHNPPQQEIYHAYRTTMAMIFELTNPAWSGAVPHSPLYFSLIAYHLKHMFDHQNITPLYNTGQQQATHYGHPNYPYPQSLTSESALWAKRMKIYFQRLPDLVSDMENDGLGNNEQMMSGWILMMFRGMCWSRCHVLISGKTIPIQYCGSQLPVYLG